VQTDQSFNCNPNLIYHIRQTYSQSRCSSTSSLGSFYVKVRKYDYVMFYQLLLILRRWSLTLNDRIYQHQVFLLIWGYLWKINISTKCKKQWDRKTPSSQLSSSKDAKCAGVWKWSGDGTKAGIVRFVAPGAPSTRVLDTTLDSPGLMTWHEGAPLTEERLPAAPTTTRSRQTAASSPTRWESRKN